jgi:Mn2+/Fe2+ NRAMP family transporter
MVTRRGLEDLVRERFGRATALALLLSVLAVDVITFAADLEGGGAAIEILLPFDYRWWIVPLALWSVSILAWGGYRQIQRVLGYLPLVFVAYAVAAFMAKPDWREVLQATLAPRIEWSRAYVGGAIALCGIPPIQRLFASSIAGGLATPIGLVLLLLVASDRATMQRASVPRWLLASGWTTAAVVTIAAGCGALVGWS